MLELQDSRGWLINDTPCSEGGHEADTGKVAGLDDPNFGPNISAALNFGQANE